MSFPPSSPLPSAAHSEPLQAIACPDCFGAVAVGPKLLGRAATCPLCGSGFRVPASALGDPPPHLPKPRVAGSSGPRPRPSQGTRKSPPSDSPPWHEGKEKAAAFPYEPPGAAEPDPAPTAEDADDEPQAVPNEAAGMQLQEPVRTLVAGGHVITLHRLSSKEKAVRRARRNVFMLLTGVSILMAIVLLLGRKRHGNRSRQ